MWDIHWTPSLVRSSRRGMALQLSLHTRHYYLFVMFPNELLCWQARTWNLLISNSKSFSWKDALVCIPVLHTTCISQVQHSFFFISFSSWASTLATFCLSSFKCLMNPPSAHFFWCVTLLLSYRNFFFFFPTEEGVQDLRHAGQAFYPEIQAPPQPH